MKRKLGGPQKNRLMELSLQLANERLWNEVRLWREWMPGLRRQIAELNDQVAHLRTRRTPKTKRATRKGKRRRKPNGR